MSKRKWITPFVKQYFVVTGVSLNMASSGIVMGYTTGLLTQLKSPESIINIDDNIASWIAAAPGFTLVLGNILAPFIMAKWGRKMANLISIIPLIIGWLCISAASNLILLLSARFIQGISLGMSTVLSPVLIGEYSSPKYRGLFLMSLSTLTAMSVLLVHALSLNLDWQITALIFSIVTFLDLIIVILSPESPSWLAGKGKYDECRRVFHWLRENSEDEELRKLLASNMATEDTVEYSKSTKQKIKDMIVYFKDVARRREFYKPVIIMIHLYTLGQWAGINIMSVYTVDIIKKITGKDDNSHVIGLDIQRVISVFIAMFIIRKTKRRSMLFVTTGINVAVLVVTAAYTLAKKYILTLDHPYIGLTLLHIHMFAISCGTLPLPFVISGEIFPLQFRSLAGGLTILFFSLSLTITVKTMPIMLKNLDIHGSYLIYAVISLYSLLVAAKYLPETKDRTLQDIEDDFKGKKYELKPARNCNNIITNGDDCEDIINTKLLIK